MTQNGKVREEMYRGHIELFSLNKIMVSIKPKSLI